MSPRPSRAAPGEEGGLSGSAPALGGILVCTDKVLGAALLHAGPRRARPAFPDPLHQLRRSFPRLFHDLPRSASKRDSPRKHHPRRSDLAHRRSSAPSGRPELSAGRARPGQGATAGARGRLPAGARGARAAGRGRGRGRARAAAPPAEQRAGTAPARRSLGWTVSPVAVAVTVASARLWAAAAPEARGGQRAASRLWRPGEAQRWDKGGETAAAEAAGCARPPSSAPPAPGDCGLWAAPGRRPRRPG
ncbi:scavenger receptor class F member 2-like [Sus scrofa]|uniref:scavenger receptor class F member 2-like n=1 Tax=Sus scrofa TaxID=9823 RepID=UPI000A2B0BA1|nr:scavenger receptor class F member 2-like [Sus scrofa]